MMDNQISTFTAVTTFANILIIAVGVMVSLAMLSQAQRATVISWTKTLAFNTMVIAVIVLGVIHLIWFLSVQGPPTRVDVVNIVASAFAVYFWVKAWAASALEQRRQKSQAELDEALGKLNEQIRSYRESK